MPRDNTAAVKTVVQSCSQFRRFVRRIENEAQPVALTDLYPFARGTTVENIECFNPARLNLKIRTRASSSVHCSRRVSLFILPRRHRPSASLSATFLFLRFYYRYRYYRYYHRGTNCVRR